MATTYYLRNTARTFAADTYSVEYAMEQTQGSSAAITYNVAASAAAAKAWVFSGPANEPNLSDWPSSAGQNYILSFDVTAMPASLSCAVRFNRYSSGGTTSRGTIASVFSDFFTYTGTGIKTSTLDSTAATFTINGDGARAASDIPVVRFLPSNSDMMTAYDMTINVNDADSYFQAPWTMTSADPVPKFRTRALQAVARSSNW